MGGAKTISLGVKVSAQLNTRLSKQAARERRTMSSLCAELLDYAELQLAAVGSLVALLDSRSSTKQQAEAPRGLTLAEAMETLASTNPDDVDVALGSASPAVRTRLLALLRKIS